MNASSSEHWIDTERGKLFAKVWAPTAAPLGSDRTIVLFHDSLGCVEVWRDFPHRLAIAARLPVVAYDRIGFGRSDPYRGALPVTFIRDEAAESLPRLRQALGIKSMVPFGHSVGGAMAVATAAVFAHECAALVTESAQTFVEDLTLDGIRAARTAFQQPGEAQRLERYHGAKARWVLDAWIETWLSPAFRGWSLEDDLKRVRCPTLAIHGNTDEYGSLRHVERIVRFTQGSASAVVLEECGHVPHREQPERVLNEVTQFLGRACEA